jgi:HPt (histidine-containing phosphotransfer) domain-containing protein
LKKLAQGLFPVLSIMNKPTVTNQTNAPFTFNPVLDVEFLHSVYDNDFAYAREVFENFLAGIKDELARIENAFKNDDLKTFRALFHKIKPTFSLVGLSFISVNAEELIKECENTGTTGELSQLYTHLKNDIYKWLPVVEDELTKLKNTNQ